MHDALQARGWVDETGPATNEFVEPANENVFDPSGAELPSEVTLEQFLRTFFGDQWTEVWTCNTTMSETNWTGQRGPRFGNLLDNYFVIGLLDPAADRRASDNVVLHTLIFADDVGTKVPVKRWDDLFAQGFPEPTAVVETSPGNKTYIWRLGSPIAKDDEEGVKALRAVRAALGNLGLSDPLPDDARYIRLPWGVNSKPKYADANGGKAPAVKLLGLVPENAVDIEQAAAILLGTDWKSKADSMGITGTSHSGALHRVADMNNPEPIIRLAQEIGLNPHQVRPGVVEADCPNADKHTDRADTGFAFLGNGLMKCSHGHCQNLRTPDFTRLMQQQYDARQNTKAALGMLAQGEPETASEFLARAAFAYHDNRTGQSVSGLQEEAARITLAQHGLPSKFSLTPVSLRATTAIPPRQWLYGNILIRGHVSLLVSPGGLGKSSEVLVEALAMATGRAILGDKPVRRLTVWVWNGEDPNDENERRLAAAAKHHGVQDAEIGARLFLTSGRDLPITIVNAGRDGTTVAEPVKDWLVDMLKSANVDLLVIDPFVTTFNAPENDNTAMNAAIATWREIAHRAGCAILLVHHVSKAAALDGDGQGIYGSRGGGALIDGVRSARFLVRMTKDEATRFGISEPWRYFRVHNGKSNLAPPEEAEWRRMVSVPLRNGAGDWPDGDVVGVVEAWSPPKAMDMLPPGTLRRVQDAITNRNEPPRANERADDWVGYLVADAACVDIGQAGDRKEDRSAEQNGARTQVRRWLEAWLSDGSLVKDEAPRKKDGRKEQVILVGKLSEDGTEAELLDNNNAAEPSVE